MMPPLDRPIAPEHHFPTCTSNNADPCAYNSAHTASFAPKSLCPHKSRTFTTLSPALNPTALTFTAAGIARFQPGRTPPPPRRPLFPPAGLAASSH